jgi:putative SOS response-associated peptidase YedK
MSVRQPSAIERMSSPDFHFVAAPMTWINELDPLIHPLSISDCAKGVGAPVEKPWVTAPLVRNTIHGLNATCLRWGLTDTETKQIFFYKEVTGNTFGYPCLVPVSYVDLLARVTGKSSGSRTSKVRISPISGDWFGIAGIWRPAGMRNGPEGFAILTRPAGPEIFPLADTQPLIVEKKHWALWLSTNDSVWLQSENPKNLIQVEA